MMRKRERGNMFVLLFILIQMDISVAKTPRQEILTVTQHTQSPRARRHADPNVNPDGFLTGKDFPDHMMFTLHLKDRDVTLQLQKFRTPQTVKLHDQDGPIYVHSYDKHRQYAVYQDVEFTSSMIVECWQSTTNCILDGRFQVDGVEWKLNHRGLTDDLGTYNATEVIPDVNKNSVGGIKPEDGKVRESKDKMNFVYKMLNAFISRESTNEKESTSGLPTKATTHVRMKRDVHAMRKRGISTSCNIIEIAVYADHTVWNYFLSKNGGNDAAAEIELEQHYEFLFAQVDLRFRDLDQHGICLRIYPGIITIEKTTSSEWALPLLGNGNVNAALALVDNCADRDNDGQDLVICTTRKNLEWVGENRPADYRTLTFLDVLCQWPGYTYMITEDIHDDQDLLLAHVIGLSLGSDQDSISGCDDSDAFIGSTYNDPPSNPPTTDTNPWRFSVCSVNDIGYYLNNTDVSCLQDGSISESDVISFNQNRLLPGKLYDLDEQCSKAFGLNITACQSPSETSIFAFDEICVLGVYCFVNSACTSRTRVYNGSPCGCKKYCFKNLCIAEFNTTLGTDCNSVCNNATNTCVCNEHFYQQGTGDDAVCVPKIELGNNCSVNGSCKDDNAQCVDGICTCNPGYTNLCGQVCLPMVDVGDNCSQIGICRDENAECVNGVCTCNGNYFVDCGGTTCLPYQSINKPCNCSDQCSRLKALCIEGKCQCNSTDFVNQYGDCEQRVDVGENCTTNEACDDEFAECSQSGICTCKENFVDCGDQLCRLEQCIGGACNCSLQCSSKNGFCNDAVCTCNDTDFVNAIGVCETQIGNGDNCTKFDVCADVNACCGPDSDTCGCVHPYYDSNGDDMAGGDCILSGDNGDNCTMDKACFDYNAECESGVCTCTNGYTDCGFNECLADQCIGDSCNCTGQCYHKNGFCETGTCRCNSTEYVNEDGNCATQIGNGDNCTKFDVCADVNACCGPDSNTCGCVHPYYDSNGDDMAGGVCILSGDNGDNCTMDQACFDYNAECESGICTCTNGYTDCGFNECLADKCIGDSCNCTGQCYHKNGFCETGTCRCNSTEYVNEDGNCATQIGNGDNCTKFDVCADVNACCGPDSNTCGCVHPYYDSNGDDMAGGVCILSGDNGDNCTMDQACFDYNAECESGICTCTNGYTDCGFNECLAGKCIGDSCNCTGQCYHKNGFCETGTCRCNSTEYVNEDGNCATQIGNGDNCTKFDVCTDVNACCGPDSNTCGCVHPYYDSNGDDMAGGVCILSGDNGDNCTMDQACFDYNAECESGICTCTNGYTDCGFNECLADKCIGDSCNCTGQCYHKNGFCETGTCRCNSTEYVNEDGNCATQIGNGDNCTKFDVCADVNACCGPDSNTCGCVHPYYDSNGDDMAEGVCILSGDNGDNCTMDKACFDYNAECESGICTCTNGYTDCGFNECLADKCIGDSCNCTGQCSHKNGFCETGTCRCNSTEYVNEDGNCATQIRNGDNCTKFDVCADVNACCGPYSNKCGCVHPYYDSNGDDMDGGYCILSGDNGDNCTMDEACFDYNAECDSGICTCTNGYTDCGFNKCLADTCIGDSCNCTGQCSHKNGFCETGTCRCNSTEYVNEDGNCATQIGNGDNCTKFDVCADVNACCGPDCNTCGCVHPYYDSNGDDMAGGDCILSGDNGDNCTIDEACFDYNAECESGICTCTNGYTDCGFNECLADTCIGDSCNCTGQCSHKNGFCETGTCRCNSTEYVNEDGNCATQLGNGDNCTKFDVCADINACCVPNSNTCRCVHPYYDSNGDETRGGDCILKVAINESCTSDDACADCNAVCDVGNTNVCKCGDNFEFSNGTCVPSASTDACTTTDCGANGGACETTAECVDSYAECVVVDDICGKICRCTELYYYEGCSGTCVLRPVDGDNCTESKCNDQCVNGTCDDDECKEGILLGEECGSAISCALHPKVKCVTYQSLKMTPPDGGSSSRKICVCDDNKGWVEFGGKCECCTVGDDNSQCSKKMEEYV